MENSNTDNREVDIKKGNYIEVTEGNYTEAIARDYIQGDYLVNGHILTFNHTEILQSSGETIKSREFIPTSPYKGLNKFDCEDKDLFFGRDQFLTGLVNELQQSNLILLMGASGSGKSSVVRAGLIPWLAQKWGSQLVKIIFTPDRDPFDSFYASLLSKYKQSDAQIAREAKADTLHRVITKLKQPDEYWLIVLDQFEELFTTTQGDNREIFINSLIYFFNKTKLNSVKIIGTMRADFLDKLSPHSKLVKMTDKHRPMIAEMQPHELRLAIEQPAANHGVIVDPGLVQEILKDIQGQAGYLPLLQYTLKLLWETELKHNLLEERTLNLQTYSQLGRVQGALEKHVTTLYQAMSPEEQQATQRIFLKLVEIGEDAASGNKWKPVRRRASKSLFTSQLERQVLLKLIDENLLVSDFSQETKESTIDIAHEILLTSWTQLNEWIKENREAIAIRNRLNHDMNLWKRTKSDDELWSGSKLEQVLELRRDLNFNQVLGGFSPEENQFIDLSQRLRERQRRKTISRLSGLSIFFLILAGVAGWQWRLAESSKQETIVRNSQLLFNQGQNFEALIEILRAATPFSNSLLKPRFSITGTLINAVYAKKESKRLEGHEGGVESIAFSPDGKTLASASYDNTIKLWNVETGEEIHTLLGHQDWVWSIAFSPDGKTLASGSKDNTIKLWNVETGKEIHTLLGHQEWVWSIAFSPDGKTLASGSKDKTIKLWNVETGEEIHTLRGHEKTVKSIAFSPDGKTLASGSYDKTIKLWDVKTAKTIHTLTGHQEWVWSIAFSPDGKTLASMSRDNRIKLWNVATGKEIHTLTGHREKIDSLAFSPDGKTLASGSRDKTIKLWNVETGKEIHTLIGHQNWVWSIAFSPDGKTLASGSKDKTIKLWNVDTGQDIHTLTGHQDRVSSIAFSPDGKTLASGSYDKTIKLWNLDTGQDSHTLTGHQKWVSSIAFSPDGKTLASGSTDQTIKLWNVETGEEIHTLRGHQDWVWSIAFSPDGKTLASSGGRDDKTIKLWNVETGEEMHTLLGHENRVQTIAFSPDGKTLASGSDDKFIKLWNVESREEIHTLLGHQDWVLSIAFSPDGKTLASGSGDKFIKLWNVESREEIHTLRGHTDWVRSIAFSPDGKTLASGSDDNSIKLWNVESRQEIHTLNGHQDWVRSIAYSPDGKTLASGSDDQTTRLWNVEDGEELYTWTGHQHQDRIYSIAFSPDGRTLAFPPGQIIMLWNINFNDLLKQGCNQVDQYLRSTSNVRESYKEMCEKIVARNP